MRFLLCVLATVSVLLWPVRLPAAEPVAATPEWLNLSANALTRWWSIKGFDFRADTSDAEDALTLRVRPAADVMFGDTLFARFEAQGFFLTGERLPYNWNGWTSTSVRQLYVEGVDTYDGALDFKVGRQVVDLDQGRMFSENDWHLIGATHDAVRLGWTFDPDRSVSLLLIDVNRHSYSKTTDGRDGAWLAGLRGELRNGLVDRFNPYWLYQDYDDDAAEVYNPQLNNLGGGPLRIHTLGFFAEQELGRLTVDAEAAYQTGDFAGRTLSAYMGHAGARWATRRQLVSSLGLRYDIYSGDDGGDATVGTFQPLFPDHFAHAGLMGWFGLKNLRVARADFNGLLPFDVDWHASLMHLSVDDLDDNVYSAHGRILGISRAANADRDLGYEIDLILHKEVRQGVTLELTGSLLEPGDYPKESLRTLRNTATETNTMITFSIEVEI